MNDKLLNQGWIVLVDDEVVKGRLTQPTCLLQLPRDIERLRLLDDGNEFDVKIKFRGRWRSCIWSWRIGESDHGIGQGLPYDIVHFGRITLRSVYHVKSWNPKGRQR